MPRAAPRGPATNLCIHWAGPSYAGSQGCLRPTVAWHPIRVPAFLAKSCHNSSAPLLDDLCLVEGSSEEVQPLEGVSPVVCCSIDACAGVQTPHDWCIMLPLSQRVHRISSRRASKCSSFLRAPSVLRSRAHKTSSKPLPFSCKCAVLSPKSVAPWRSVPPPHSRLDA